MDHSMQDMNSNTGMDMNHTGMEMNMMQMSFYAGCESTILFDKWQTKNCLQMFGSCMVIILASILYEGLKALRNHMQWWMTCRACKSQTKNPSASSGCCSTPSLTQTDDVQFIEPSFGVLKMSRKQVIILLHFLQSFLYLVQVGFGYLIMLVAMTYNVWLFISIFIGSGLGYLIFNFKKILNIANGMDACPSDDLGDTHCHL